MPLPIASMIMHLAVAELTGKGEKDIEPLNPGDLAEVMAQTEAERGSGESTPMRPLVSRTLEALKAEDDREPGVMPMPAKSTTDPIQSTMPPIQEVNPVDEMVAAQREFLAELVQWRRKGIPEANKITTNPIGSRR